MKERKRMLTIKEWYLEKTRNGHIFARGNVFGHPRLEDKEFIHTSNIIHVYLQEDGTYIFETYSGSLYFMDKNDIRMGHEAQTLEFLNEFELERSEDVLERMEKANRAIAKKKAWKQQIIDSAMAWMQQNAENNELYLVIENMEVQRALYKWNGEIYEEGASVHLGMFQDSVLLRDWEHGKLDFRYFPNWTMEPYEWSGDLEKIYIFNIEDEDFDFKGVDGDICCKAGELTAICKCAYVREK